MSYIRRVIGGMALGLFVVAAAVVWGAGGHGEAALAACSALPSDKGQASFTVNIPSAGTYRVWSRIYSPSAGNDGFYMQIDQSVCNIVVGNAGQIGAGQFTWVDWTTGSQTSKFNANLSAGSHQVIIAGLDSGVGVDKIMFLSDTACVPTGTGQNCASSAAPTATPVSGGPTKGTPTPTPVAVGGGNGETVPVSGKVNLDSDDEGTTKYYIDGKEVSGDELDTTKLPDGTHTLKAVTTTPDGKVTTKEQTISVQNGWQYKLVAGMKTHWPVVLGSTVLLLMALVGGGLWWRRRRQSSAFMTTNGALQQPSFQSSLMDSKTVYPQDRELP